MTKSRARAGAVLIAATLVTTTVDRQARAQVPDAAYNDLKGIIQDLLTREVAESVVPQLSCRAGREPLTKPAPKDDPTVVKIGDRIYRMQALVHYPQTLQRVYSRQFGALRSSVLDESADLAAYIVYKGLTPTSGQPVSTLSNKLGGIPEDPKKKDVDFAPFDTDDDTNSCVEQVGDSFKKGLFVAREQSPLDKVCNAPTKTSDGYRCELAYALRAVMTNKPAIAEDRLIRAVALIISERLSDIITVTEADKRHRIWERVVLALRDLIAKDGGSITKFSGDLATQLNKELGAQSDADKARIVQAISTLADAVDRLAAQWHIAANLRGAPLDVATFIDSVANAGSALRHICGVPSNDICTAISDAGNVLARGKIFWPLIRTAGRGDIRDAAHMAVLTLFKAIEETEEACKKNDAPCKIDLYRRFADAVVMYTIDTIDDGKVPSEATRAAFREATTEVVHEVAKGGGFDRSYGWSVLLPDLGLRASWNAGYVNQSGSSFRYLASANCLTFRLTPVYSDLAYTSVHFSLLDPLAPLSELATRRNNDVTYASTGLLSLNLVTPRLDVVFGIPALSKHLVFGAGASLRPVVPLKSGTTNYDGVTTTDYTYHHVWDDADQWPRFIEFGFVTKFVI